VKRIVYLQINTWAFPYFFTPRENNRLLDNCKIITISRPILARANMGLEYSSGLNINIARSEILVWCLVYIDQLLFFKQIVDIFFSKAYCQELYILITEYCNVVRHLKDLEISKYKRFFSLERP
jgi:hypothetical protein